MAKEERRGREGGSVGTLLSHNDKQHDTGSCVGLERRKDEDSSIRAIKKGTQDSTNIAQHICTYIHRRNSTTHGRTLQQRLLPPSPPHKEAPLIPRHHSRGQRIPPPTRQTTILVPDQIPPIQPLAPVPVQILLRQTHKPVVRAHTADEVELAPGGVALARDKDLADARGIGGRNDRLGTGASAGR